MSDDQKPDQNAKPDQTTHGKRKNSMTVKRVCVEFTEEDMKSVAIMANHVENKDEYNEQMVTDAIERATRFWNEMYRLWRNENKEGMTNETK